MLFAGREVRIGKNCARGLESRKLRNCLFLRSLFTFYVLCSEKKNFFKRRESWKISSGPYAGSGWENPDRSDARENNKLVYRLPGMPARRLCKL